MRRLTIPPSIVVPRTEAPESGRVEARGARRIVEVDLVESGGERAVGEAEKLYPEDDDERTDEYSALDREEVSCLVEAGCRDTRAGETVRRVNDEATACEIAMRVEDADLKRAEGERGHNEKIGGRTGDPALPVLPLDDAGGDDNDVHTRMYQPVARLDDGDDELFSSG